MTDDIFNPEKWIGRHSPIIYRSEGAKPRTLAEITRDFTNDDGLLLRVNIKHIIRNNLTDSPKTFAEVTVLPSIEEDIVDFCKRIGEPDAVLNLGRLVGGDFNGAKKYLRTVGVRVYQCDSIGSSHVSVDDSDKVAQNLSEVMAAKGFILSPAVVDGIRTLFKQNASPEARESAFTAARIGSQGAIMG